MNIKSILVRNFVCYRGEHTLELDAKPYAVLARANYDQRRSNWLGKSTLLESVWFALYGEHRWASENAWITHGEQEGGVELVLTNGMHITRSRIRGDATRLKVGKAKGDEAQALINEAVGLDKQDFEATCYFRQKRMNRFIVAKPAERMDVLVGWLRLEKLDECIDMTTADLSRQSEGVGVYQSRLATNRAAIEELARANLKGFTPGVVERAGVSEARAIALALNDDHAEGLSVIEHLAGAVARLEDDNQRVMQWRQDEHSARNYASIVEQGKQLKAEIEAMPNTEALMAEHHTAKFNYDRALSEYQVAKRDLAQKDVLRRGSFDGKCPVAGMQCPAQGAINADLTRNATLFDEARKRADSAKGKYHTAETAKNGIETTINTLSAKESRLDILRESAKKLHASANRFAAGCPVADYESLQSRLSAARDELASARARVDALGRAIKRLDELLTDNAACTKHIDRLKREADTLRESLFVFRRARQRIAEGALATIEQGANSLLFDCSIDLTITARWQREGEGLADTCDACGAAFGASRKVKVCARCGEARGPKLVNKLELVLSNTSGAAEDLGGGAFQLSASAWLRKQRACGWSVAMIDEPFGALDESNRDAFAAHLGALVRGHYGFEQALIVSHSPSTSEALPGRIEITSDGLNSVPRVVS